MKIGTLGMNQKPLPRISNFSRFGITLLNEDMNYENRNLGNEIETRV